MFDLPPVVAGMCAFIRERCTFCHEVFFFKVYSLLDMRLLYDYHIALIGVLAEDDI